MLSGLSDIASSSALAYFSKKFPYKKKVDDHYRRDERKVKKYKRLSILAIVCALVYLLCFPFLFAALLYKVVIAIHVLTISNAVYYEPGWIMFIIPGAFLGWGLLVWLYEATFKLILQSDYEEFEDFYNKKQGYDNHRAGLFFCRPFLLLAVIALIFTALSKVTLNNSGVAIRRFYDVSTSYYPYADVARIIKYHNSESRDGQVHPNEHYVLSFKDGLNVNMNVYFSNAEETEPFIKALIVKSGKNIEYVAVKKWE